MIENRLREASSEAVYPDPTFLDVGGMNNARYRDVIVFDLSEYTGAGIQKAVLSLYWYYPEGSTRPQDTVIEVYRPASAWNSNYVSWTKRDKGVAWNNAGGDWYDKNGVLQGSTPYATLTLKGSTLPDNRYYELDVTDLVKEYIGGKYENTGFLIKARTENDNYIAFYSSKAGDESQKPRIDVTVQTGQPATEPDVYLIIPCYSEEDAEAAKEEY
uniref:disaggregatase related repeat-containing protein n=1 Tax=Methanosarcina horonobensis TaxID=418008 RepID=UPI000A658100